MHVITSNPPNRLATFVSQRGDQVQLAQPVDYAAGESLFDVFTQRVGALLATRRAPDDAVAVHGALLSLAQKCYPARADYQDAALASVAAQLGSVP